MTTAAQALRDAIEACHRARAAVRLQRWRDPREDAQARVGEPLAWLRGEGGQEALAEALGSGEVDADAHRWLVRHVAHLQARLPLDDARRWMREDLREAELPGGSPLHVVDELGALAMSDDPLHRDETGRALEVAFVPVAERLVGRRLAAERDANPEPALDFGGLDARSDAPDPEPDEDARIATARIDAARAFLEKTEDAARDAVEWQVRGLGAGRPVPWHALVRGLRARDLDAPSKARMRLHRVSAVWRRLGFEEDMNARMRAEKNRGGALPFASIACVHAPRDVRVALPAIEWGVLSDACAAQGAARGLAQSLALRTHPLELRRLLPGGVAGVFGALALQLWGERAHLQRLQGLSRPEAERVARVAGAFSLLVARGWAALASAPYGEASDTARRMELLAETLGNALCCDVPPGAAALLGVDVDTSRARSAEHLGGLALAMGLRERHDEDWFLDGRLEERFRGAGQRGNTLSIEALCDEIGVDLSAAGVRGNELVA